MSKSKESKTAKSSKWRDWLPTQAMFVGTAYIASTVALGVGIGNYIQLKHLSAAVEDLITVADMTLDIVA